MGGCVSLILADTFMSLYKTLWPSNFPSEFKPVLYKRYADDSFLLFRTESHVKLFLDYSNAQHPLGKFTHGSERNGYLPFLDGVSGVRV